MPVGGFFVHAGGAQKGAFSKLRALQLQADRQTPGGETARDTDTADACQIAADRINVTEVHGQRVSRFLAHLEGGGGCGRPGQHIALAEDLLEIFKNEPTHPQ